MLWRQLFSKKSDHPTDHIEQAYSAPLGFVLESRVLFDGAIAATATQAETSNSSDATASSHPAQTANHSAEATSENNTSSDQNSATHDITTDVVVQAVAGETIRKEAVFIDTALTDYQTLVNSVPAGVDVFLLDSSKDGLTQMAIWAETHTGYDAIHILSHGNEGQVRLGNLTLDSATAEARSADLAKLGTALTQDGDLLLYGCDIAQDTGKSFVSLLAQLTQADIAASDDLTGAIAKGGNWQLETTVGSIETNNAALGEITREYNNLLASPTFGTNTFSQFSGTTTFVSSQTGLQSYDDLSNGFTYVAFSTDRVSLQTATVSGNQVLNTIVAPGGDLNYFAFKSTDGSEFKLSSIDLRGLGNYASTFTITGYKDGSAVAGVTQTITLTIPFQTVTLSNAFQGIDEVRLTTTTIGNGTVTWDNIVTAPLASTDNVPSIVGSATNPTYTENGAAVGLFTGVSVNTNDSGQTFTGATLTISNVAGNTEYLTLHGINVALSHGNSVSLGSGYGSASVSLSGGTATVSITGATLSNSDMGSLLSGMTYGNSSDNPGNATRTVTLTQLTDSGTSNNTVAPNISSAITVVPVNDAPIDLALSNTTFGQSLGSNGTVAILTATDMDSSVFTYSLVSGSGSTDNALFTISGNTLRAVNAATMAAGTYSVRLQVSDGQATYEKAVTLTVADDIAPTFDATPTITSPTAGGFTLNTDLNERGTIYYVVLPDGASAPSVTQVINGQTASGSQALASGSQVSNSPPYSQSLTVTGLALATAYDVYVVARDSAGNSTVSVVKLDATTAASGTAPTLSATGSNPVFIGGMAGAVDLFSGVSADTRDSGQTFNALTLTVSNVNDSGEFISVAGNTISLASNGSGTLTGIGSYTVTRVGNTVTLQLSGMTASNTQFAGLVDGLRYGNSNSSVTAATRDVSLTAVSDSGTSNNTTSLNLTSSVNVLASNSALYVTSGDDTGVDAAFGNTLQDDINDGGGLSLREALHWANVTPGIDRIVLQTNVTLADNILVPTSTLLLDGQSFILNGGGYSGFQITSASFTFAIQNLTLTNFTTTNSMDTGGILGLTYSASDVNLRLYNVDITGNSDDMLLGNGMIDLNNISSGTYVIDLDRVNIYKNTLAGGYDGEGVIKLFVSGTMQTVSLSLTNSAIYNNSSFRPPNGVVGVAGLYLTSNGSTNAPNTHITLMNTTITGQDAGIVFDFTNAASSWVASVRNSIISGNTVDIVIHNDTTTNGSYTLNGGNNLIGSSVDLVSSSDPRLAATASNAINQGDRFYVTGNGDARGLDRVRQGAVDIGAYESQFASGVNPQVDLNGAGAGSDYSATVSSGLSTGVPITDMLATLSQTDGDTRLWTLTLALAGSTDGASEYLTLSQQALLAAHAAGINVSGDGSQTLTLTGGATSEAFQTALRAIVYVNVATTPSSGARTISVTANDDASSSATSTLTVVVGNPPVVATPIPAQSIAQNGSLNFTVPAGTFTDPDVGDTLTLSATLADGSALPAWLSFNAATGTFSGTPGNADVGSLSIRVTATDGSNASVYTDFSLTVTNVNDAPVVATPIPAQSVVQDGSLSFTVPAGTFTDPDVGDTLTLSATLANGSPLPGWITFNPTTGTFSGTPGNADVGSLSIRVTATDGSNASVYTDFSLTVTNVNDAPVVATPIPAQSVVQDGSLSFTVPAGTFTDPDVGDTLPLSATLADGSPLPGWITFNPTTGTFSGTPGNADVGSLSIRVTATDGSNASVYTDFSLTVTNVNDAPVVATPIPAQSVVQDGSLNFTVPAGTFTDPDVGDTLTLSATLADGSPLPGWLTFNAATGTFSGTPGNADVGSLSIRVTATDGTNASVYTDFSLTVTNVNDAPVVATPIPAQSVPQDGSLSFTVPAGTFTDPDVGDTLTLSATLADGSPLPGWITFNSTTGTFSGTPGNADVGSLSIRVTATDGSNASVYTDFSLTVTNVNDAPVVATPIPAQSVAQDGSLNFTVPAGTFTDPDVGDTLTLSATLTNGSPLPGWLTFNSATGTFSGTPGNADVGSLSIRVTATDGSNASVHTDFSLTVTNVNDAPVVATPIPAQSVAQDGSLNFTVPAGTFTDPDVGDTLTLSATLADGSPLPGWITFNPTTGTFSGTPGNGDVGNLSIKVTANDGDASVSTSFSLTVTNVNDVPVVANPIPAQSVAQDGSLNFTVPAGTFTDPDGDTLTLSATLADGSPLPSWLSFNAATGTFSGTPGNSDVGNLSIKVMANDGDASVSTSFSLTVTNINDAPVVATPIPAQSVAQDGSLNFTVPAGTFTDPDGDTLTLSATLADGSPLPGWLSFNPATGTFSGTPANGDVGNLSIKVTANDGDASVSTSFSLTVTNVNDAPVVSATIPPQSIAQDGSLSFTVPAGTFTDPDGDTLTLSATLADGSPLPSWLSFNAATGTFSGTPGNGDVGNLSIKVTANDGDASVSTSFSLTVTNVNDVPVVANPIPAQSVAQDGSLNFTVPAGTFTDPDGDTLTLSATLADGSPLPSWLSFNAATGTFSGTPGNSDVGNLSIKVTANDGDASVSTSFSLAVTNVNDVPVVANPIPAQSVAQDGSFSFTVPAGTFTDPDGDTLTLSATLADGSPLPSWLSFNAATGTFSGTPGNGDVGSLTIKVTANDGDASVSTSFSLTVTNVNDVPVVANPIPAQSVAQDGSLNFTVPSGTFTDPDGDTLTLSATLADGSSLPGWLSFNPTTGTFSGTPGNGDVGNLSIKVTANDGDASVSTTFSLTVTQANQAPVVSTPIPPQSVAQDGVFNFTVPAGTFSDPDGDTLTLSATLADGSPLPGWLTFNPATGTFSGTPGNGDVGTLVIRVTATDGSNTSISTSFGLTVTNVNDAPVVGTPIPPQSVAQDGGFNFTVPAGTFSDPDGDTLTLSATLADGSPLPGWLTFNPATGTFSGTPGNGDVGTLVIRVTATDGSNTSISTSFGLTVTNVNDAPVVGTPIPPQSVAQDGGFNFTVPAGTFSDPDGDTLTLSATLADGSPLPGWLTFNPATGTFSGTPGNGDVGTLVIRVTATDGSNTSISTSFGLTVTNVNDAPVVGTPIPPQSVAQDGGFNFTVPAGTFSDPDGDTLTLSATLPDGSPLPGWLTFNPATGTFSGTPGNGDVGTLVIRVTATDGSNTSISTSFGLTVTNVNDAPVVGTPIPPQSVAQDGGFNFTVPAGTFSDPDGDTLTLSATLADGSPLPGWLTFNPATGTFSGTPGNGDVGTLVIRVTATDGSNTSISTSFGLTVTNVNDAPVVGTPIPPQSVAQDGGFNFTVPAGTFSDPDGDTLTLSATLPDGSPLPGWLTFNPATGTFSGTPGNGDVGTLVIRVTATDGSNTSISTSFGLTVTRSIVGGDPQFKANDGLGRTPSFSDTRQLSTQDAATAEPTLGGLITNPSLGSLTVGNDGAPRSVMSAIFATGRQNTEGGTLPTSQVAGTFGHGVTSGIGVNFDSTLGSFPSFSKDPALGGTSSLASAFSGIYLPSLTPMEVFSGGSWKDIPLDRASNTINSTDDSAGRSVTFTPSLHRQLQQIGDSELQRLAAIEQALLESGQQQG
ncbi:putative Ig domain-containing protein [Pectobacterium brasiliense]|uniref:putative Ig domain-containing protein n=1 Tax=Pectobacterium brasiliense TaxID=180957 RepID=UPI00227CFD75|nr:putative Ig domain-containing protein [Pectobacterium brasiliense]WGL28545.1 putative Ig domain-containing protein [Pectobacterium brasiliense]